ncbi:MAG TPA: NAD-dependent epimerase/dehydratase family protein [Candidatus Hydrogenedentes bacterium]|nr:NAD-dependent epimerase/dehydratase family protein [Candidatus Hydrogenedentota bacterium]
MSATRRTPGKPVPVKTANPPVRTEAALDELLSTPAPALVDFMDKLQGDLLILGAGGKVGHTLARMAVRAVEASGVRRKVIGVATFSAPGVRKALERLGVETHQANLMEPGAIDRLPDAENVLYLVGRKFGSTGAEWDTWAVNVHLSGLCAQRYRRSRIVSFSSGNIYPFLPVGSGGATEETPVAPVGEYAMTTLGRERMFDYYANHEGTKVLQFRLNYAAELRYGIVHDVASKVWKGEPVDLSMGHVNVVWQGYVCNVALLGFGLAASPARILNVAGPETVSIRWMADRLGRLLGKTPKLVGEESPNVLLSNAAACHKLFGYPQVSVDAMIEWVAYWVASGGSSLGKPTHYETRDGKF